MALIDREKLKEIVMQNYDYKAIDGGCYTVSDVMEDIDLMPTVESEQVRHGHNENQEYHEVDEFRCSECGLHLEDWTRYVYDEDSDEKYAQEYVFKRCPECGAKIGGAVI